VSDGHHRSIFTLLGAAQLPDGTGPLVGAVILDQADCAALGAACAAPKGAVICGAVADGRLTVYLGGRELASVGGLDRGPMPPIREAMAEQHTAVDHGFDLGLVARVCGAAEKWLGPKTGTEWVALGFGARLDARRGCREFASVIMGMRI
jgi:hypothetical protein